MLPGSSAAIQLKGKDRNQWENSVISDARLETSTDIFLMTMLLRFCQGKAICWPTVGTLSSKMKMSERTIQSAIKRCVKAGVIRFLKDTGLRQGRRFVITSHPASSSLTGEIPAESTAPICGPALQNLRAKIKENSSDSSLRSESSSSKQPDDVPPEKIHQVKAIFSPSDASSVLREHRILERKAMGQWDLVIKASQYVQARRPAIREVVPYLITVLDSWKGSIPPHIASSLWSTAPIPDQPLKITRASPEKVAWYTERHARKALAASGAGFP